MVSKPSYSNVFFAFFALLHQGDSYVFQVMRQTEIKTDRQRDRQTGRQTEKSGKKQKVVKDQTHLTRGQILFKS